MTTDHTTSPPLDDAALNAIEARAEAATPGPWEVANDCRIVRGLQVTGRGAYTCIQSVAEVDETDDRCDWGSDEAVEVDPGADAEFIAAARQDVPALVAEVRRLTAVAHQLFDAMQGQHAVAAHHLEVFAFGEDCRACRLAADECDGALCCDEARKSQKQFLAALGIRLPALPTEATEETTNA